MNIDSVVGNKLECWVHYCCVSSFDVGIVDNNGSDDVVQFVEDFQWQRKLLSWDNLQGKILVDMVIRSPSNNLIFTIIGLKRERADTTTVCTEGLIGHELSIVAPSARIGAWGNGGHVHGVAITGGCLVVLEVETDVSRILIEVCEAIEVEETG